MAHLVQTTHRGVPHDCLGAMDCGAVEPGHAVSFMQDRVASATPSKWRDSIVDAVSDDGWVTLTTIDDRRAVAVWNHAGLDSVLSAGDPVAVHALYNVLAVGSARYNVVVAA